MVNRGRRCAVCAGHHNSIRHTWPATTLGRFGRSGRMPREKGKAVAGKAHDKRQAFLTHPVGLSHGLTGLAAPSLKASLPFQRGGRYKFLRKHKNMT